MATTSPTLNPTQMANIKGRILRIYSRNNTSTASPLSIPEENSCNLSISDELLRSASEARSTTGVHIKRKWTLNISVKFSITEFMSWYATMRNGKVLTFFFGYKSTAGTLYSLHGDGFPTRLSLKAGAKGIVYFNITIQGTGPLQTS